MLSSGDRNRRLTLWRPAPTSGPRGGEIPGWAYAGAVWASKVDIRDAERYAAAQVGTTVTARFGVLRSSLTGSLDPSWQIELDGVRYAVVGMKEVREGGLRGWELTANALSEPAQR